ncbi:hypothetical protein QVD17_30868 [Tagetes erecta]|uniref:Reverse transcriptase Ty1/copia-type domain-containing protein n=1 Tax=Tagetes erecta TaxID=13708 RepID=A0AAD8NNC7_TARER|nr:hypothetical protein QVD17_30868 [Tagetes erecta]
MVKLSQSHMTTLSIHQIMSLTSHHTLQQSCKIYPNRINQIWRYNYKEEVILLLNISEALEEKSWLEAMQEELLQFRKQEVWKLVDLPEGENGYTQEKGIDNEELFALVAPLEAIRVFLAYASFMKFKVYQMDVKGAFLYAPITGDVYVRSDGSKLFMNLENDDLLCVQVYVDDIIFGSTSPSMCKAFEEIMISRLQMSSMGEIHFFLGLHHDDVCVCARYQSDPKVSHLIAIKRILRYLKGKPNLSLWYPYNGNFELYSYSASDYGGCTLDRKSTTGGCQFLGPHLVSWQCKKQTNVSVSTVEAEYIVASAGCSQVLWLQNQLLDYVFNFLKTPIYIDNTAAMFITANPVQH